MAILMIDNVLLLKKERRSPKRRSLHLNGSSGPTSGAPRKVFP